MDEDIVHLTIDGELLETTAEHPFYTEDGTWVDAADLEVGERILSLDGDYGTVEAVEIAEDVYQPMYNLTVDEAHTFYVGEGDWLVHNTCPVPKPRQQAAQSLAQQAKSIRDSLARSAGSDPNLTIGLVRADGKTWVTVGTNDPGTYAQVTQELQGRNGLLAQLGIQAEVLPDTPANFSGITPHAERQFFDRFGDGLDIGISNWKGPCADKATSCSNFFSDKDVTIAFPRNPADGYSFGDYGIYYQGTNYNID